MPEIDAKRLLSDLRMLATFGKYKTGVHRPTFSEQDMAARRWFADRLTEAGMEVSIDGVGNVCGLNRSKKRLVLAGSHIESQNHAGWLDGALGSIYALEAARTIAAAGNGDEVGLDVVGFADEEGHFGSFIGSRSFIGVLPEAELDASVERGTGTPLRQILDRIGLGGKPRTTLDPSRYRAFFEAHIEQGDILESEGLQIGVVTAVVAIWQYRIVVTGEQNHAGTTSMQRRRDAGAALVRLLAAVDQRFPGVAGLRSVWTTGQITLSPGAKSIIPGEAEALLQFRDTDPETLLRMENELQSIVDDANATGRCKVELTRLSASKPSLMDDALQGMLDEAAERRAPGKYIRMPSGAGHDAQWLAQKLPTAMLFVPSIGGISHHWTEDTAEEDIVLGAQVFTDAIWTALTR